MRTEAEIQEARRMLERARDNARRNGSKDGEQLAMFVDLLKWVQNESSAFGKQYELWRAIVRAETAGEN